MRRPEGLRDAGVRPMPTEVWGCEVSGALAPAPLCAVSSGAAKPGWPGRQDCWCLGEGGWSKGAVTPACSGGEPKGGVVLLLLSPGVPCILSLQRNEGQIGGPCPG